MNARSLNWAGAFAATSKTGELSGMYHALDWINTRRTSPSPVVPPRYDVVFNSDYCVKLIANPVIARIHALLAKAKQ